MGCGTVKEACPRVGGNGFGAAWPRWIEEGAHGIRAASAYFGESKVRMRLRMSRNRK